MVAVLLSLNVAATQQRSEDLIPVVRGPIFSSYNPASHVRSARHLSKSGGRGRGRCPSLITGDPASPALFAQRLPHARVGLSAAIDDHLLGHHQRCVCARPSFKIPCSMRTGYVFRLIQTGGLSAFPVGMSKRPL
jgi:hypothetical protein